MKHNVQVDSLVVEGNPQLITSQEVIRGTCNGKTFVAYEIKPYTMRGGRCRYVVKEGEWTAGERLVIGRACRIASDKSLGISNG